MRKNTKKKTKIKIFAMQCFVTTYRSGKDQVLNRASETEDI